MLFKGWLSYKCDLLDVSFNSVHMQHINLERVRLSKTKTKVIKSKDTDNVMNQSNWKQMHMADNQTLIAIIIIINFFSSMTYYRFFLISCKS